MMAQDQISRHLNWLLQTISFLRKHFITIFFLGLIAAFGRTIQLGGFGKIDSPSYVFLEVLIELSRILIFVFALGFANFKTGISRIKRFIVDKKDRKLAVSIAFKRIKARWFSIILNIVVFLMIAWTINYLIDLLAYQTCFYLTLKKEGILMNDASEWTVLLFFKNISVIPFTLIFEALFLLWITNRIQKTSTI